MELAAADDEVAETGGGVFAVPRGGKLPFSKNQLGRFLTDAEVDALAAR